MILGIIAGGALGAALALGVLAARRATLEERVRQALAAGNEIEQALAEHFFRVVLAHLLAVRGQRDPAARGRDALDADQDAHVSASSGCRRDRTAAGCRRTDGSVSTEDVTARVKAAVKPEVRSTGAVSVDLDNSVVSGADAQGDTIALFENAVGGAGGSIATRKMIGGRNRMFYVPDARTTRARKGRQRIGERLREFKTRGRPCCTEAEVSLLSRS